MATTFNSWQNARVHYLEYSSQQNCFINYSFCKKVKGRFHRCSGLAQSPVCAQSVNGTIGQDSNTVYGTIGQGSNTVFLIYSEWDNRTGF